MKNFTKLCLSLIAVLITAAGASAQQQGVISGIIRNAGNGNPLENAFVEYFPKGDLANSKVVVTDKEGAFTVPAQNFGDYNLYITFIGFEPQLLDVVLDSPTVHLDTITLTEIAKEMEQVVVTGFIRASLKGDTLSYMADGFKTTADATAGELIAKMPGITVEGGEVTAQGQAVKKVLLDGKEYFGEDVTLAINNLPAEIISNVETFTKMSDQAEFSGIDDGEGYKVLNFITRNNVSKGVFGRIAGSYGIEDKYMAELSYNNFMNERVFSVAGLTNNINKMSFSTDDLLSAAGGSGGNRGGGRGFSPGGVNTFHTVALNYVNTWKKFKLSADYKFDMIDNLTTSTTERNYFFQADTSQFYHSDSRRDFNNYSHTFGGRLEYKINDKNNLMMRPFISIQNNNSMSTDTSFMNMTTLNFENAMVNMFRSLSDVDGSGYRMGNMLLYQHKFGEKAGRILTVNLNGMMFNNTGDDRSESLSHFFTTPNPVADLTTDIRQKIDSKTNNYSLGGGVTYSEPITPRSQLIANYNINYDNYDTDRQSRLWDPVTGEYIFSDAYSNVFKSNYITHRVGPGYRYNDDKTNFVINVNYQHATREGEQTFPVIAEPFKKVNFENVVYNSQLTYKFNQTNNLRINVRSNVNNPSITDLQDVLNISNPMSIILGNPDLRTSYEHSMTLNYQRTNISKGHTFNVNINGYTTANDISRSVIIADRNNFPVTDENGNVIVILNNGAQFLRPVNLDGRWSLSGNISYGMPIKFIKSNINLTAGTSFNAQPGMLNNVVSTTNEIVYRIGATLSSNISRNLDFTFNYRFEYSDATNNVRPQQDDRSVYHRATGRVKWITWKGITLTADAAYDGYRGITQDYKTEIVTINASLGKKIFKSQLGEISVGINDLLDQNKSFNRSIMPNYIQSTWRNTLGRYVSINLIYNIRKLNGAKLPTRSEPDNIGPGGPPDGGRGGGFGGGRPPGGGGGGFGGGRPF